MGGRGGKEWGGVKEWEGEWSERRKGVGRRKIMRVYGGWPSVV